jgi:hypothetical protein
MDEFGSANRLRQGAVPPLVCTAQGRAARDGKLLVGAFS